MANAPSLDGPLVLPPQPLLQRLDLPGVALDGRSLLGDAQAERELFFHSEGGGRQEGGGRVEGGEQTRQGGEPRRRAGWGGEGGGGGQVEEEDGYSDADDKETPHHRTV